MRKLGVIIAAGLLAGLMLGLWWYYQYQPAPHSREGRVYGPSEEAREASTPSYPVPAPDGGEAPSDTAATGGGDGGNGAPSSQPEPLPPVGQSDEYMLSALLGAFPEAVLDDWLKHDRVVERLVVTVNSLDGPAIPLRFWPVHHLEGLPTVAREDGQLRWSEANVDRYRPVVRVLGSIDPHAVARVYFRNYPLFQQAYDSLGLGPAYFNDRLVAIIDHLLEAPTVEPGFAVRQPKVLYEFADPALESESWGRKLLMRMGPDNASRVKNWLRRLRREVASGRAGGP